jgi:hypothetical protein
VRAAAEPAAAASATSAAAAALTHRGPGQPPPGHHLAQRHPLRRQQPRPTRCRRAGAKRRLQGHRRPMRQRGRLQPRRPPQAQAQQVRRSPWKRLWVGPRRHRQHSRWPKRRRLRRRLPRAVWPWPRCQLLRRRPLQRRQRRSHRRRPLQRRARGLRVQPGRHRFRILRAMRWQRHFLPLGPRALRSRRCRRWASRGADAAAPLGLVHPRWAARAADVRFRGAHARSGSTTRRGFICRTSRIAGRAMRCAARRRCGLGHRLRVRVHLHRPAARGEGSPRVPSALGLPPHHRERPQAQGAAGRLRTNVPMTTTVTKMPGWCRWITMTLKASPGRTRA